MHDDDFGWDWDDEDRAERISEMLDDNCSWVDADGEIHDLVDMDEGHRFNVLRYLRNHAAWLHEMAGPDGSSAEVWLEATPLVIKLRELCGEDLVIEVVDEPIDLSASER